MILYLVPIGKNNTYFLYDHNDFNINEKIERGALLTSPDCSLDHYDYYTSKCGENMFTKMNIEENHSF